MKKQRSQSSCNVWWGSAWGDEREVSPTSSPQAWPHQTLWSLLLHGFLLLPRIFSWMQRGILQYNSPSYLLSKKNLALDQLFSRKKKLVGPLGGVGHCPLTGSAEYIWQNLSVPSRPYPPPIFASVPPILVWENWGKPWNILDFFQLFTQVVIPPESCSRT